VPSVLMAEGLAPNCVTLASRLRSDSDERQAGRAARVSLPEITRRPALPPTQMALASHSRAHSMTEAQERGRGKGLSPTNLSPSLPLLLPSSSKAVQKVLDPILSSVTTFPSSIPGMRS